MPEYLPAELKKLLHGYGIKVGTTEEFDGPFRDLQKAARRASDANIQSLINQTDYKARELRSKEEKLDNQGKALTADRQTFDREKQEWQKRWDDRQVTFHTGAAFLYLVRRAAEALGKKVTRRQEDDDWED